ncbi:MAG: pilus assembly protein [Sphingomonadaceae bacterium]
MTLVLVLVIALALAALGISAAELAWQGEKAARAQRDREVAFQAAEAALEDAEKDIAASGPAATEAAAARKAQFDAPASSGFAASCGPVPAAQRGLLLRAPSDATPAWQVVDLSGASDAGACSVPLGTYTGAVMETGQGFQPFQRPRYIIERMECHQPGDEASAGSAPQYCYRVTAIGFGAQPATEVVLQTVFRRPE